MRDYGKVHTSFWSSSNIRALSEDGRTLAMYLLTCPHGTIAGVFRLPDGYASEDLQWDSERVREGFVELLKNGFADRCETTKWVWVRKHLEWNPPENPNQRKAAVKVVRQIPVECSWIAEFTMVCGGALGIEPQAEQNGSGTVQKGFLNQEQEQEQEQKQEQEQEKNTSSPALTGELVDAELLPAVAAAPATEEKPRRATAGQGGAETALQISCRETWAAYCRAYADRYGAPPVRAAKQNAQVKQIVQALGAEEAPQVAAWFVGHPAQWYVTKGHDIGLLLTDITKLRTEWATGRVVTSTVARQADRRGAMASAVQNLLAECEGGGR